MIVSTSKFNLLSVNLICSIHITLVAALSISEEYWHERAEIIKSEEGSAFGSEIILNEEENRVNRILMKAKIQEIDKGSYYLFQIYFI